MSPKERKSTHTQKADLFSPLIASSPGRKQATAYRAPTVTRSSACLQSTKSSQKVLRCFIPEPFTFLFLLYVISNGNTEAAGCILIPSLHHSRAADASLFSPSWKETEWRGKVHFMKRQLLLPLKSGRLRRGSLAHRGNGNVRWPTSIQLYKLMLSVKCRSKLLNQVGTTPLQPLPTPPVMKLNEWSSIAW